VNDPKAACADMGIDACSLTEFTRAVQSRRPTAERVRVARQVRNHHFPGLKDGQQRRRPADQANPTDI
jgi:hypothetical protein